MKESAAIRPLGIITEVVEIGTWVYNWISKNNRKDKWSSWPDSTKEAFVSDALNAAFSQNSLSPKDWFWNAISNGGYTSSGYDAFMAKNADWIPNRITIMESRTGRKYDAINQAVLLPSTANNASFFTSSIAGILGGVLFFGIAAALIYNSMKNRKK